MNNNDLTSFLFILGFIGLMIGIYRVCVWRNRVVAINWEKKKIEMSSAGYTPQPPSLLEKCFGVFVYILLIMIGVGVIHSLFHHHNEHIDVDL